MNKDHQGLTRSQHLLGIGSIVTEEMKLEPSRKSQEIVRKSSILLRQIPQSVMSWAGLGEVLVGNNGKASGTYQVGAPVDPSLWAF